MNAPDRARKVAAPLLLLAVTLLGGGLRVYAIGQKGLWLDEAFSIWLGWHRLPEMWGWIAQIDQHPPLYYTLLGLWMLLGDDAATVRLLSAAAGILTIPVVYLLGQRLAGQRTGLLTALVLAVSPFHVRFAQEARMYTLLTLAASATMVCLAYLLTESNAWRKRMAWTGYVIFTAAAMLTHSTALLLLVAPNLFVFGLMWRQRGSSPASLLREDGLDAIAPQGWGKVRPAKIVAPRLRGWLLAQGGVLLLWGTVWLPAFISQAMGVYREFWMPMPTWRTVVDMLGNFISAHLPRQQLPWLDIVWVVCAILLALGTAALRKRPAVPALLLTLFLTPVLGELLISLRRPVFYDRTLIWAAIPLYVLLSAGIAALSRWPAVLAAAALLFSANGLSLREYYVNYDKEGWREAAAYVSQNGREGDLILFNASWVQIPFDYYFRATAEPVAEHGLPTDLFERGILEPKMEPADLPRLRELIQGRERVWLVYSHNWYTDPQGLIPDTLRRALTPAQRRTYEGLELQLYEGAHDYRSER
jgi:uncharacterized membrane protein